MHRNRPAAPVVVPPPRVLVHTIGWRVWLGDNRPFSDAVCQATRDLTQQIDWPRLQAAQPIRQLDFIITFDEEVDERCPEYRASYKDKEWPTADVFALQPVILQMGPEEHARDVIHTIVPIMRKLGPRWNLDMTALDGVVLPPKPARTAFFGKPRKRV